MSTSASEIAREQSKRPSNSAFKQQKLPAWQPILTAGTVLPTFFIIGLAFIPIGVGLLKLSNEVTEVAKNYTDCKNIKNDSETCDSYIHRTNSNAPPCYCHINLTLPKIEKDVYMYYGLTNFYQNHRRYVKSRDDNQLLGNLEDELDDTCSPFQIDENTKLPIAPCGAIANSMFNDVIKLYHTELGEVSLLNYNIAWHTDKTVKFQNPAGDLRTAFNKTAKPPNWEHPVYELSDKRENNGFVNEDFIVWMRTAALPNFRKLYRRINHTQEGFKDGLPAGEYRLEIKYTYKVTDFKGTKSVILSNTSWLGGKNSFLGVAYITVGSICLTIAIAFLVLHFKFGKRNHDLSELT